MEHFMDVFISAGSGVNSVFIQQCFYWPVWFCNPIPNGFWPVCSVGLALSPPCCYRACMLCRIPCGFLKMTSLSQTLPSTFLSHQLVLPRTASPGPPSMHREILFASCSFHLKCHWLRLVYFYAFANGIDFIGWPFFFFPSHPPPCVSGHQ